MADRRRAPKKSLPAGPIIAKFRRSSSSPTGPALRTPLIPKQAQRLLDQVTVLAAGEAILFGSAFHIPARAQVRLPSKEPWSATAAPYVDWSKDTVFPLADVIESWGISEPENQEQQNAGEPNLDDEMPF